MEEKSLFGTSGIRGDAEKFFTKQFCFDIGRSFIKFLTKHKAQGPVAIGMDPRGSSPRIKDAVVAGINFEDREVFDQGTTCVPSMNYVLKTNPHYSGSIMVSGSHIKPHLNGIKFFAFGEEILKVQEKEIENIYFSLNKLTIKPLNENLVTNDLGAIKDYKNYLVNQAFKPYPKWRVVVDPGDGAQSDIMPNVLQRLGLDVIEMNATIQGEFFSRDTEVEGDFKDLQNRVLKEKADFGIGYDSDGDRCIFIDEKGNFIPGDYTGTLIAKDLPGDSVVTPINTSSVIDSIGKTVYRTKVGSPYVVKKMKQENCNFGFEANGGGIFQEMLSRDGGRVTIEILNILLKSGKRLSDLVAELPKYYLSRNKIDYKWELKEEIMSKVRKYYKDKEIESLDGIKIWMDKNTWILFRSSSNAPEFRVFVESDSKTKSNNLLNEGISIVKKCITVNE